MANILPKDVAKAVKVAVYEAADEQKYCTMTRPDAGAFMDGMVARTDVGGIIGNFIEKSEIRTYIKDGILNAYSKKNARKSRPTKSDICDLINSKFEKESTFLEGDGHVEIYSHRDSGSSTLFLVSFGTFLKWETVLRKLLIKSAFLIKRSNDISLVRFAILTTQGKAVPNPDKQLVVDALELAKAKCHIVD